MKRAAALGLLLGALLTAASPALAQAIDRDDDGPVTADRVSEEATRARRLVEAERWGEAAPALRRVAAGETGDGEGTRQMAQYHLAIALHRLDFHSASLAIFSAIADQPRHVRHAETLPWLARLAEVLPEPAGLAALVGRYDAAAIARFDSPALQTLHSQLAYLLGRHHYDRRAYDVAIRLFAKVAPAHPDHARAQFYAGVAHVQLRRSTPAVRAFERMAESVGDRADGRRMRDLAALSTARAYYAAALQGAGDAIKLSSAITWWNRVDPAGEGYLDALFEQAWAYFMAGDLSRALGNLHALEAPFFEGAFYPEAEVLRGVVSLSLCRYDDAMTIALRMRRKYEPIKRDLEAMAARFGGDIDGQQPFRLLEDVRAGKGALSPRIRPIVVKALSDRQIVRHLDYVRALDAERDRFRRAPAAFRSSPLGADVEDAIDLARDLAVRNAGALARARCERVLGELDGHLRDGQRLLIEAALAERDRRAASAKPRRVGEDDKGRLTVGSDEEHEVWPFDGEYWRDEIGSYRQVVISRCGR